MNRDTLDNTCFHSCEGKKFTTVVHASKFKNFITIQCFHHGNYYGSSFQKCKFSGLEIQPKVREMENTNTGLAVLSWRDVVAQCPFLCPYHPWPFLSLLLWPLSSLCSLPFSICCLSLGATTEKDLALCAFKQHNRVKKKDGWIINVIVEVQGGKHIAHV